MFACVSFARVKKAELPPYYLVVTFGLNYAKDSGRVTRTICPQSAKNRGDSVASMTVPTPVLMVFSYT